MGLIHVMDSAKHVMHQEIAGLHMQGMTQEMIVLTAQNVSQAIATGQELAGL